jgi:succinate dehydrogenase / fumarate reductase flavoprotein subunit
MALRAGFPVQDIEMWQFHPTGIHGAGTLVTEGCRGEGGYLVNKDGERFMERYAPNAKDLAGRDVVARSMVLEILEGRGCGPDGDHVYLKLDHLGEETLNAKLPGILELSRTFAHADPVKEPIPVVPTCHYMMGGIPTNVNGQALTVDGEGNDHVIEGFYACGEAACVSVHGANRLGGNSLLDLVVFGRASGMFIEQQLREGIDLKDASEADIEAAMAGLNHLNDSTGGENAAVLRSELQTIMQNYFGVFRRGDFMQEGIAKLAALRPRIKNVALGDKSNAFNTSRIEALELQNLFEVAEATAITAEARTESRGAHAREDFQERDDVNWLCHSLFFPSDKRVGKRGVNFNLKTREAFEPQIRTY